MGTKPHQKTNGRKTARKSVVTKADKPRKVKLENFQNALKSEKMIHDLIIKSGAQDQFPKIFKTIESNLTKKKPRGGQIQFIPHEEIKKLCSLIQKDRTSISAQSINQLLQPYIKTTLTMAGGLSLGQTLIHYLGENVLILGAPALVTAVGMFNYPLSVLAKQTGNKEKVLQENEERLQGICVNNT